VHRDLKPANVLLELHTPGVQPRISDFGLVKQLDTTLSVTGVFLGTLTHAAPEQLLDASRVDARADLFSLGVILVELLTGHLPYFADTIDGIQQAHARPPDLGQVPAQLRPLCEALLQPHPNLRPPNVAAVQSAIQALDLPRGRDLAGPIFTAARRHRPQWDLQTVPSPQDTDGYLPSRTDLFVGREPEFAQLEERLNEPQRRPVTLVGPGGVGKTRLAVQFAAADADRWPDGVWFCDISAARSTHEMVDAVRQVLKLPPHPHPHPLLRALRDRPGALLILDTFEHLPLDARQQVAQWASAGPQLLITSRSPLNIYGERLLPIEPLSPALAARLLEVRMRDCSDAQLPPALRDAFTDALDHLPLNLELLAQADLTDPQTVLRQIQRCEEPLRAHRAGGPARHQSLEASLEWSWALLDADQRVTLTQCAVFDGGFSLEAADAVVRLDSSEQVEHALEGLLDQNMVMRLDNGRGMTTRLGMLKTTQRFALRRLEDRDAVERRHIDYFASFGRPGTRKRLMGANRTRFRNAYLSELHNLLTACQRAGTRGDVDTAVRCALAADSIYWEKGPYSAGRDFIRDVRRRLALDDLQQARLLSREARLEEGLRHNVVAWELLKQAIDRYHAAQIAPPFEMLVRMVHLSFDQALFEEGEQWLKHAEQQIPPGDFEAEGQVAYQRGILARVWGDTERAVTEGRQAVAMFRKAGSIDGEGRALRQLATALVVRGSLQDALDAAQQSVGLLRASGYRQYECTALITLSWVLQELGRFDPARITLRQALEIGQSLGDRRIEASVEGKLGEISHIRQDLKSATHHYQTSRACFTDLGDRRRALIVTANLGMVYLEQGMLVPAERVLREALRTANQMKLVGIEGILQQGIARLKARRGDPVDAFAELDRGEALLRRTHRLSDLGDLLVFRAELALHAGDRALAVEAVEELAAQLAAEEPLVRHGLSESLARLQARLADSQPA
ncbi:MAG: tetratricopeptide repeat protein, partial [Myxococcota bacterium]